MGANFTDNNSKAWAARRSTENLSRGRRFEGVARAYCRLLGYSVCATNFRLGHLEADILAEQDGTNIVVEVRGKSRRHFLPSRTFSPAKYRNLRAIAQMLTRKSKKPIRIELFEILDAFKGQENFVWEGRFYRVHRIVLNGPGV